MWQVRLQWINRLFSESYKFPLNLWKEVKVSSSQWTSKSPFFCNYDVTIISLNLKALGFCVCYSHTLMKWFSFFQKRSGSFSITFLFVLPLPLGKSPLAFPLVGMFLIYHEYESLVSFQKKKKKKKKTYFRECGFDHIY